MRQAPGGLVVLRDTARFYTTAQNIGSSAAVSDTEAKSVGCLGLKLKLQGGKKVITTVTHAYVRNPVLPGFLKNACCKLGNSSQERPLSFQKPSSGLGFTL